MEEAAEHYVHLLVVQRLRTPGDRHAAAVAFERAWERPLQPHARPSVAVGPGLVQLGRARLPRASVLGQQGGAAASPGVDSAVTRHRALCVCRLKNRC